MSVYNIYQFDSNRVRSDYLRNWLNILCNTEKRYDKFVNSFLDHNNLFLSACRYQRYLREEEGRGKDIMSHHIQKAIDDEDVDSLVFILQELFIEPIDNEGILCFVNLTQNNNTLISDFLNMHKSNRDKSFWLTIKKFI